LTGEESITISGNFAMFPLPLAHKAIRKGMIKGMMVLALVSLAVSIFSPNHAVSLGVVAPCDIIPWFEQSLFLMSDSGEGWHLLSSNVSSRRSKLITKRIFGTQRIIFIPFDLRSTSGFISHEPNSIEKPLEPRMVPIPELCFLWVIHDQVRQFRIALLFGRVTNLILLLSAVRTVLLLPTSTTKRLPTTSLT
jgi:hypothetical protein